MVGRHVPVRVGVRQPRPSGAAVIYPKVMSQERAVIGGILRQFRATCGCIVGSEERMRFATDVKAKNSGMEPGRTSKAIPIRERSHAELAQP